MGAIDTRSRVAASSNAPREDIAARLRARRGEIEQAAITRVYAIADPIETVESEYVDGLKLAISAALGYGLAAIEHGDERTPPVPTTLLAQARLAARNRVSLDTVLRRYCAGQALFVDYLIEEAKPEHLDGFQVQQILRTQASLFDHLLAAVSEQYAEEARDLAKPPPQGLADRIDRLLAGELADTEGLRYDFAGYHLGLVAVGDSAASILQRLAREGDHHLLLVRRSEDTVWAWLGGRHKLKSGQVTRQVRSLSKTSVSLAVGEPGKGIAGWRLTHQQARAVLPVTFQSPKRVARYADTALLASVIRDALLSTSLRQIYLAPLEQSRDSGVSLIAALRAYFSTGRNVSSAAAALGLSRQTVSSRLQAVEAKLDRTLDSCAMELELALQLEAAERGYVKSPS